MRYRALLVGMAVLVPTLPVSAQAPVQGSVTQMTKSQVKDTGTITVQVGSKQVTYQVSEATTFQYFNQVSTWGANFLNVEVGKNVAVAPAGNTATLVQILLPAPPPPPPPGPPGPPAPPPKPSRVHGTVTAFDAGSITIKLPNRTPPPPVEGKIIKVTLDEYKGHGYITIHVKGAKKNFEKQTFLVTAWTHFTKLGVEMVQKQATQVAWHETFLSIDRKEHVKIFPRYGAPMVAQTVDILLKGAQAPPAIVLPDHFLQFQLQPTTSFETVRSGTPTTPTTFTELALGEQVGVLPAAIHSPIAADVHIRAPKAIEGTLVHGRVNELVIKTGSGKGATQTVPLHGRTQFLAVQGTVQKPASREALHKGEKVIVYPHAAPPHAAQMVLIHPLPPRPSTTNGVLVAAADGMLVVKSDKGTVRSFTLHSATKLEAHDGKKTRAAGPADFVPGAKITVVALNQPPHLAQSVRVQVSNRPVVPPVTNTNKKKK